MTYCTRQLLVFFLRYGFKKRYTAHIRFLVRFLGSRSICCKEELNINSEPNICLFIEEGRIGKEEWIKQEFEQGPLNRPHWDICQRVKRGERESDARDVLRES